MELTDQQFNEVVNGDKPVLVDYYAEWCGPCRRIAPTVAELEKEFKGKAVVAKVDIDSNPKSALEYDVGSIPTLILFYQGKPVERFVGITDKKTLGDALHKYIGKSLSDDDLASIAREDEPME